MFKKIITSSLTFIVALVISLGVNNLLNDVDKVNAGNEHNLFGFSWADTIGWMSSNNLSDETTTSYGLDKDGVGSITGHVWSDSIGWIKFDNSYAGPNGQGPAGAILDSNNYLKGWARACSGTVNRDCTGGDRTDGWNGWIQLSGSWNNGVRLVGDNFEGFAWSDNMGWIDFNPSLGLPIGVCVRGGNCPTEDTFQLTLEGKRADSSELFHVGTISVPANEADEGVSIRWDTSGDLDNVSCEQVEFNGNPVIVTSPNTLYNGEITIPNLTPGENYPVSYNCTNTVTFQQKSKSLVVEVASVYTPPVTTSCAPIANAVMCENDEGSNPSTVVDACSAPVGSSPNCQFTCLENFRRVGNTCRMSPIFEEI